MGIDKSTLLAVHRWSGQTRPRVDADTASINFVFDASGTPLVAGARANISIGVSGRIVRATILADVAPITATFILMRGTYLEYPSILPIYTLTAQRPQMALIDSYKVECNLEGWEPRIRIGDTMICVLESVTGGATSLSLNLQIRKHPASIAPVAPP